MRVIYERNMQDYANEIGRDDVRETLQRIIDEGKESEFESLVEDYFLGNAVYDEELYDLLRDDWERVYKHLGIPYDDEGIDDDDY